MINPRSRLDIVPTLQYILQRSSTLASKVFDVKDYGAEGDGATDDSAAFDDAIAAMSDGDVLYIPAGHYMLDSGLTTTTIAINVKGDGSSSILDFSNASNLPWTINGTIAWGSGELLTSDANADQMDVAIADASACAVGDWIRISSADTFHDGSTTIAELHRIASIAGNTITLDNNLAYTYLTSDTAQVIEITMLEGVSIEDVKMIGRGVGDTSTWNGVKLQYINDLKVDHLTFEDGYTTSFTITDVVDGNISNSHFGPAVQAGYGYGLQITQACKNITVSSCTFRNCRHGISLGGADGVQRKINIIGNHSDYHSTQHGFIGGHDTYDGIVVDGNSVWGNALGYFLGASAVFNNNFIYNSNSSYGGLVVADPGANGRLVIAGNNIYSPGNRHGLRIRGGNCEVSNNSIISATNIGALILNKNASNVNVSGNWIKCIHATGEGIRLSTADTTDSEIQDINITGNYIEAYDGIQLIPDAADIKHVNIRDNHIMGTGTGISSTAPGVEYCEDIVIDGNTFNGVTYAINTGNIRKAQIANNKIDSSNVAIKIETEDNEVINNVIVCAATSGVIRADDDYSGLSIHGNRITDTAAGPCILLMTAASSGTIENISIRNNKLTLNYTGIDVDPDTNDIENLDITNNMFIGGSSLAIIFRYDSTGVAKHVNIDNNNFNGCNTGFNTREVVNGAFRNNKFIDITANGITINTTNEGDNLAFDGNIFINCGTDISGDIPASVHYDSKCDNFLQVLAADTDYVHAAEAGTGAAKDVTTNLTNPDVPRILTLTMTNVSTPSGTSTITGTDVLGHARTEDIVLVAGGTASGNIPFAKITKYTIPAGVSSDDTVACGIGDKLGLASKIWTSGDVYKVKKDTPPTIKELSVVRVALSSSQSISAGVSEKIELNSEAFDSKNEFDNSTDYEFTATVAGKYLVLAQCAFNNVTDQDRIETWVKVNSTVKLYGGTYAAKSSVSIRVPVGGTVDLNANDTLQLWAYSDAANDVYGSANLNSTFMCIYQLLEGDDADEIVHTSEDITVPTVSETYNTIDMATITEGDSYSVWYRSSLNYHY